MKPSQNQIFYFIVGTTAFVLLYVLAVTFFPIPKANVRFVDTVLGFLLGTIIGGGFGYLVGGTPEKKQAEPGTATAEFSATISNDQNKQS